MKNNDLMGTFCQPPHLELLEPCDAQEAKCNITQVMMYLGTNAGPPASTVRSKVLRLFYESRVQMRRNHLELLRVMAAFGQKRTLPVGRVAPHLNAFD